MFICKKYSRRFNADNTKYNNRQKREHKMCIFSSPTIPSKSAQLYIILVHPNITSNKTNL